MKLSLSGASNTHYPLGEEGGKNVKWPQLAISPGLH